MNADDDGSESPRDAAIDWWVRRKAGDLSRKDQAAFEAWLAADPANRAAFDDISRMSADLARLRPSRAGRRDRAVARGRWLAAALATAAASGAVMLLYTDFSIRLRADHYAGTGETKLVTLEDGSRVELDARSAITLRFTPAQRRITLLAGEAWFTVARDQTRPFLVEAAGGTIKALGTAFDVALEDRSARVVVTEHRVSVSSGGRHVVVRHGQETTFEHGAPARPPVEADVARLTAWRRGKLIVENRPLGDVLEVLGRYRRGFVTCLTPAICARRVSGVFGTDDPLQAISEIEAFLGVRAFRLTDYLIVLHE